MEIPELKGLGLTVGDDYNYETHDWENCECGGSTVHHEPCNKCMYNKCQECTCVDEYFDDYNIGCESCNKNFNCDLERIIKMTENAKFENVVACLNDNVTTIRAKFINKNAGDTDYMYKISKDIAQKIEIGDKIVTEYGDNNKLNILEVTEVHDSSEISPTSIKSYKWAICKVDISALDEQKNLEAINVDALRKRQIQAVRQQFLAENNFCDVKLISSI